MTRVLLINQDKIPHYRVPVYGRLSEYLHNHQFVLTVVADGIQTGNPYRVEFDLCEGRLTLLYLLRVVNTVKPDAVIFWVNLRHWYLFPLLIFTKLTGRRVVYWGHGVDLLGRRAIAKNVAYAVEHFLSDAIILYADHLRQFVGQPFHHKVFIANNTLNLPPNSNPSTKLEVLARYGIATRKNIICVGRLERRKRLGDLIKAFQLLDCDQYGLVLVGPDLDGSSHAITGRNIYKLGPVYGEDSLQLLRACDVYCLPGHVGLGIVDALYSGLPVITEDVDHAPEIMYLKDGENGFIVPKGDVRQLADKLQLLLENGELRATFSEAARREIETNGHIDVMCQGFSDALAFACRRF